MGRATFKRDDLDEALRKLYPLTRVSGDGALVHFDMLGDRAIVTAHDDGRHPSITMSMSIMATSDFVEEFIVKLAPIRTFVSAVMEAPQITVEVKDDVDKIRVRAGRSSLTLPIYRGPYPSIFEPQEEELACRLSDVDVRALFALWSICDKPGSGSSIPLTEGVYFEFKNGKARTLATDRYKAAYVWREHVESERDTPISGVVYAEACDLAIRNVSGEVDIYLNENRVFFVSRGVVIYASLLPMDYPASMLVTALSDDIGPGMSVDSGELSRKVSAICSLAGSVNAPVHFDIGPTMMEMWTETEIGEGNFSITGTPVGDEGVNFIVNGSYLRSAISLLDKLGDDGMYNVTLFRGKKQPWIFVHSEAVVGARYAIAAVAK